MEIRTERVRVETGDRFEILNLTSDVRAAVERLDATDGLAYVSTPHTSAAVSTNEYERKLLRDMIETFTDLVPPDDGYHHDIDHVEAGEQPNAHAHLIAAMIDRPVLSPVRDGELGFGTWENVLFFELCGPRRRTVEVTLLQ
jgi:secondary thiamine-phosphate synthase enzyme